MPVRVPLLIVGGGPVGLTASICLSRFGIRHLLVEKHPGTTLHPKARNLNVRTMEIMRPWGIGERLSEHALPRSWTGSIIYTTTLSGAELGRMRTASFESGQLSPLSPAVSVLSSQDIYEPIFRRFAEGLGVGELRFGYELESFEPTANGVVSTLRDRSSDTLTEVHSDYLLACDGWNSRIRRRLAIEMEGPTNIGHFVNVYFRSDLSRWVEDRPALLYFIANDQTTGVLQPLDGRRRWLCQISYDGRSSSLAAYTEERCREWVRQAAGSPDVDVEILSVGSWTMNAAVASAFRDGPVFLAGDAAHQLPPTGGFGMNTGVQDVHNLAWKLALVMNGVAGAALLDSYEAERRPVARFNADRSLENSRMVGRINRAARSGGTDGAQAVAESRRYGNFTGMDIGFHYRQGALDQRFQSSRTHLGPFCPLAALRLLDILPNMPASARLASEQNDLELCNTNFGNAGLVPDGTLAPEVRDPVVDYTPTARPGHRAPHLVLEHDGAEISSLDLFDRSFTLLATNKGQPWLEAARGLSAGRKLPIDAWSVGEADQLTSRKGDWCELYGVQADGAVLVRPDGHVAWRSRGSVPDPPAELRQSLERILATDLA